MRKTVMRISIGAIAAMVIAGGFALTSTQTLAQAQKAPDPVVRITQDQLKWVDEPDGLGFKQAIIEGDPKKPGLYIIQVKFPPGVMSKPHFHGETRYATVIKGTWYTGSGDEFAPDKTVPLKPGSFMKHPAGAHHFDGAKDEEVIVQLMGMGPSSTTRIRPNEPLFAPSVKK
jgi:quercetin dioxygenase-like cupin family protein